MAVLGRKRSKASSDRLKARRAAEAAKPRASRASTSPKKRKPAPDGVTVPGSPTRERMKASRKAASSKTPAKPAPSKKPTPKTPAKPAPTAKRPSRSAAPAAKRAEANRPVGSVKTKGGTYSVYNQSSDKAKSFRSAFSAARKAGKKTFTWNGKKYTTEVK